MSNEPVYIGEIKRTHGVRGEVQLKLRDGIELNTGKIKFLLLSEKNAQPVPWFPEKFTPYAGGFIVKFETVNTEKDARRFAGSKVFCDAEAAEETEEVSLEGFEVEDENMGVIGNVASVMEYPSQIILAVITKDGKEILLPYNEQFVVEVDEEEKRIIYSAPEGLLDVYLNPGGPEEGEEDKDEEDERR